MSRHTVHYEWKYEILDANDDIDECEFDDTLAGLLKGLPLDGRKVRVCLVRDVRDPEDFHDLVDRGHAYIVAGRLSKECEENGARIPFRFHEQCRRADQDALSKVYSD